MTAREICFATGALCWRLYSTFDKTTPPALPLNVDQTDVLNDKLAELITPVLNPEELVEVDLTPRSDVELSRGEWRCLCMSLTAVMNECRDDPLEMKLRVGHPVEVERLSRRIEYLLQRRRNR